MKHPINISDFRRSGATEWALDLQGEAQPKSWVKWAVFTGISLGCLGLIIKLELIGIILLIGAVTVGPFVFSALWNTKIGIYIMVLFAFFLSVVNRLYEGIPLGIAIDGMIVIMVFGLIYRSLLHREWHVFTSPMSVAILLWGGFNILEVVNPWAASRIAWFYVIRPAVGYMMLYFITYSMIQKRQDIKHVLYFILLMCLVTAGWGIYQVHAGYFEWEMNYVIRHDTLHLVFNNGRLRAIGSIGSPAQYGIIMGFISIFSLFLIQGVKQFRTKAFLFIVGIACLVAMVYSGTRSSYVIIPIFYFSWVILARKKSLYYSLIGAIIFLVVLAKFPTNNYHIQRIQSVFNASEDASYQTRAENKKIIFPWILKHPIGGGLGSTGVWGQKFSPGTFLANFPPDSGLIRVAVELGWIGLIFFLNVYYNVLIKGTFRFWKMKDPFYRTIVAGMICGIAPMLVVEWGQEVVGVFPMSLLFWIFIAIMFRAIELDKKEAETSDILESKKETVEI